jgi:hypothetical protein
MDAHALRVLARRVAEIPGRDESSNTMKLKDTQKQECYQGLNK